MNHLCIRFEDSALLFLTTVNSYGRFTIASVATVQHKETKSTQIYYLLPAVLACDVFGKGDLIYQPAYLFQAVFGDNKCKIYRTHFPLQDKDTIWITSEYFQKVEYKIVKTDLGQKLTTNNEIRETVFEGKKISAKVLYITENYNIELEFPVNHININPEGSLFQVETGPVLIAGLGEGVDGCKPAYICFNQGGKMEYSLYQQGEGSNSTIRHYWTSTKFKASVELYSYK